MSKVVNTDKNCYFNSFLDKIEVSGEKLISVKIIALIFNLRQPSPVAENDDIVVFGDIAKTEIYHLPFYFHDFGGYQGVLWK